MEKLTKAHAVLIAKSEEWNYVRHMGVEEMMTAASRRRVCV